MVRCVVGRAFAAPISSLTPFTFTVYDFGPNSLASGYRTARI